MRDLDPNIEKWILEAIATNVPFKIWEEWTFNPAYKEILKRQLPKGARRRDYPYVYFSPNRPISIAWARELSDSLVVTTVAGTKSYVASKTPLDPSTIYRLELLPLLDTRADTLLDLLDEEDFPLVMGKMSRDGRTLAAAVTHDPSNPTAWRVTYFEEDVGPTGHVEAQDVRSAVKEMINAGYVTLAPRSLIDDLIPFG